MKNLLLRPFLMTVAVFAMAQTHARDDMPKSSFRNVSHLLKTAEYVGSEGIYGKCRVVITKGNGFITIAGYDTYRGKEGLNLEITIKDKDRTSKDWSFRSDDDASGFSIEATRELQSEDHEDGSLTEYVKIDAGWDEDDQENFLEYIRNIEIDHAIVNEHSDPSEARFYCENLVRKSR